MSNHDDTLLDEDLGDDVYDLRDDEEEALLADDYDYERKNSYKGEEEIDDVLDLGVTDALDDLDADEENVDKSSDKVRKQCDGQAESAPVADLRQKLQQQRNARTQEEDDDEEERDTRDRFQSERTVITGKVGSEIPDSLESVVTNEQPPRQNFRGRGRGRGMRGISRGGPRYQHQGQGRFNNPRNAPMEPQPQFRPPLMDHDPGFAGPPNQPIMYPPNGPQMNAGPPHNYPPQYPPQNGVMPGPPGPPGPPPGHHFMENPNPSIMNQYHSQQQMPPPRPPQMAPHMDFGPRGPPPFNHPLNPGPLFMGPPQQQQQPGPYPIMSEPNRSMPPPHMHSNPGPLMSPNVGPPLVQHQGPPPGPHPPYRMPDNRPPPPPQFNEPRFPPEQCSPLFDNRPPFNEQAPPVGGFLGQNVIPSGPLQQPPVALPRGRGHKILLNPHFRGNQQPVDGSRPPWDSQQTPLLQVQKERFAQPQQSPNYQNYNQSQQTFNQPKSDDPYSYFSDVWQENKPQRPLQNTAKPYESDPFSRDNSYNDYESKYRSDGQRNHRDSYSEDQKIHQNYRDREPVRPRNEAPKNQRNNNSQNYVQRSPNNRLQEREKPLPKRSGDNIEKTQTNDLSPKRPKTQKSIDEEKRIEHEQKEDDNEDPEMREYRKKMEEQKRLREKILREKENRRKIAAMEKTSGKNPNASDNAQTQNVATAKENVMNKMRTVAGRERTVCMPSAEATEKSTGTRVIRTIKTIVENNKSALEATEAPPQRRVFVQNAQRVAPKGVRKIQTGAGANNQRIVVQKVANTVKTNVVTVENLSATTTEAQIRRMCQDIGSIESIQMNEGSATIVFKTPTAALVFHKKYQRKMLDLSMITVRLVPQSPDAKKS